MNWYKKSNMSKVAEVTLYHGTTLENAESIMEIGLMPSVGDFVEDMYGGEFANAGVEIPEISFAAGKGDLRKAFNAMIYQVGKKLKKRWMGDVSIDEIRRYGAIVVFKGSGGPATPPGGFIHRPDENERWDWGSTEENPTVEPGDYYSTNVERPDYVISGTKLIEFLKRNGFIKRDDGSGAKLR